MKTLRSILFLVGLAGSLRPLTGAPTLSEEQMKMIEKLTQAVQKDVDSSATALPPPPPPGIFSRTGSIFLGAAAGAIGTTLHVTKMTGALALDTAVGTAKLATGVAAGSAKLTGKAVVGGTALAANMAIGSVKLATKGAISSAKLTAKSAKFALDTTLLLAGTGWKLHHKMWGALMDFKDRVAVAIPDKVKEWTYNPLVAMADTLANKLIERFKPEDCLKVKEQQMEQPINTPWMSLGLQVTCFKLWNTDPDGDKYDFPIKLKIDVIDGNKLAIAVSTAPLDVFGSYNMHFFGLGDKGFMNFHFAASLLTLTAQFADTTADGKTTYGLKIVGCDMILVNVDFGLEKTTSRGAQLLVNILNAASGGAQTVYATMVKYAICNAMRTFVNDGPGAAATLASWMKTGAELMAKAGLKSAEVLGDAGAKFFNVFKYEQTEIDLEAAKEAKEGN